MASPLDPFDWFDQFTQQQQQQQPDPQAVAQAQAALHQKFQPQEEDSLLKRAIGAGASGLAYVGGTLDKLFGGRAIRGALGGNAREILSAIPGSDMLGITDPEQRVSGEDLLKNAGILQGEGEKGTFEMRDLLGPAAEIALDPATYLTFGTSALTKEGQLAKKVGALPDSLGARIAGHQGVGDAARWMGRTVPESLDAASKVGVDLNSLVGKPLGGVAGLRVPFLTDTLPIGTGNVGQAIGNKLGSVYDKLAYSAPGRYLSAAFDPTVQGATDAGVQQLWRDRALEDRALGVQRKLDALGVVQPLMDAGVPELSAGGGPLRGLVEGTTQGLPGPYAPNVLDALNESTSRYQSIRDKILQREQAFGLRVEPLESVFGTQYAARSPTPLPQTTGVRAGLPKEQFSHALYSGVGHGIQREAMLDVPGGTDAINRMVMDPRIGTTAREFKQLPDIVDILNRDYLHPNPDALTNLEALEAASQNGGRPLTPAEEQVLKVERHKRDIAEPLGQYLGTLDRRRLNGGLFGNDVVGDLLRRTEVGDRAIGRANVATSRIASDAIAGRPQPGYVPLKNVLDNLRLSDVAGQDIINEIASRGHIAEGIPGVQVPASTANVVQALSPKLKAPEYLGTPIDLYDSLTNLTRTLQTSPWPGKHVRDFTTAAVQNMQAGSPGALTFGANVMKAIREGREVPGLAEAIPAFRGMTDAQATAELGRELFSQQAAGRHFGGVAREGVSATEPIATSFANSIPGQTPEKGLGQILRDAIPTSRESANPLNIAGVGGRDTTKFAPVVAGKELGDFVDDLGRGGLYADLRRQGYTPDAAGRLTEATQFKYQLSDFERKVMRRGLPFYSWTRQIIPQQLGFLAAQPGGMTAQAIRAADQLRQSQGFEPPYLEGGLSIPLGQEENGQRRYLTKLDLPWEAPLNILDTGPRGPQNTMMNVLSELNPLIKGPLEYATNKQFYTGRDLDSLYARTGNRTLDQIVMNSPLSRTLTTAGTLADERKGWLTKLLNVGTGARVSDVDMDKQRQEVALDMLRDTLRQNPNVRVSTDVYVPKAQLPQMSADDLQLLRLYDAIKADAERQAKQRSKLAAVSQ